MYVQLDEIVGGLPQLDTVPVVPLEEMDGGLIQPVTVPVTPLTLATPKGLIFCVVSAIVGGILTGGPVVDPVF
jgi:hypothetical protein